MDETALKVDVENGKMLNFEGTSHVFYMEWMSGSKGFTFVMNMGAPTVVGKGEILNLDSSFSRMKTAVTRFAMSLTMFVESFKELAKKVDG